MERAKERMAPAMMPGAINGKVTVANTKSGLAPSVLAACSSLRSTAAAESCIARTIKGKPMMAQASAAPVQRNANTMPKVSASHRPIGPWRPNRSSST
jgi:hypothetical protein